MRSKTANDKDDTFELYRITEFNLYTINFLLFLIVVNESEGRLKLCYCRFLVSSKKRVPKFNTNVRVYVLVIRTSRRVL